MGNEIKPVLGMDNGVNKFCANKKGRERATLAGERAGRRGRWVSERPQQDFYDYLDVLHRPLAEGGTDNKGRTTTTTTHKHVLSK